MPRSFVVLYRGETIATAEILELSADPSLVRDVADRLLDEERREDAVLGAVDQGRRDALELVREEAESDEQKISERDEGGERE